MSKADPHLRSWLDGVEEEVRVTERTRRALDRVMVEKQTKVRRIIDAEKRAIKTKQTQPVVVEKMHKVKYWAEMLDMKPDFISEKCREGKIRSVRCGWEYRISESAIQEFLTEETKRRA